MQINPTNANRVDPGITTGVRQGEKRDPRLANEGQAKSYEKQPQSEGSSLDELEVIKAIEHANKSLEGVYTHFEFSIHEKTREIMVKVIDRDSGEVIREIPPEQILDMVAKMWELAGILIDERV